MIQYILRRVGALLLVLLGSTFLIYNLTAISGDPLEDLRLSTEPNAAFLLEKAIQDLQLNVPPPVRYFNWLIGILGLGGAAPTMGLTLEGSEVLDIIGLAIPISIRLVIIATILSIVIGISIGIISALRQYSRFDYSITFIAFLFFSLPIFWVAVLLKQFAAIEFNNFLYDPVISTNWMIGFAFVGAFIFAGIVGGGRKRFLITLVLHLCYRMANYSFARTASNHGDGIRYRFWYYAPVDRYRKPPRAVYLSWPSSTYPSVLLCAPANVQRGI